MLPLNFWNAKYLQESAGGHLPQQALVMIAMDYLQIQGQVGFESQLQ